MLHTSYVNRQFLILPNIILVSFSYSPLFQIGQVLIVGYLFSILVNIGHLLVRSRVKRFQLLASITTSMLPSDRINN